MLFIFGYYFADARFCQNEKIRGFDLLRRRQLRACPVRGEQAEKRDGG
jgi:hypothetical protein